MTSKQKVALHIDRQHIGPAKCKVCEMFLEDIQALNIHEKNCSYLCKVPGCQLKHKSEKSAYSHQMKYLKTQ